MPITHFNKTFLPSEDFRPRFFFFNQKKLTFSLNLLLHWPQNQPLVCASLHFQEEFPQALRAALWLLHDSITIHFSCSSAPAPSAMATTLPCQLWMSALPRVVAVATNPPAPYHQIYLMIKGARQVLGPLQGKVFVLTLQITGEDTIKNIAKPPWTQKCYIFPLQATALQNLLIFEFYGPGIKIQKQV